RRASPAAACARAPPRPPRAPARAAACSRRPPQRTPYLLLHRKRLVDALECALGIEHRPPELDEGIPSYQGATSHFGGSRNGHGELLPQFEDHALGRLPADAGDRLEACEVLAGDRAAELRRRRPGDDRERDLRADARDAEQQLEQLALLSGREAVELQRVL